MTEPLKLPPHPTNHDLAIALLKTHECLDDFRKEMAPVIAIAKLGKWVIPIIAAAIVSGWTQVALQTSHISDAADHAAREAAAAKIVAASTHKTVQQLAAPYGVP